LHCSKLCARAASRALDVHLILRSSRTQAANNTHTIHSTGLSYRVYLLACSPPSIMATRRRLPCLSPLLLAAAALSLLLASTHGFVLAMALKTPKPTFGGIAHAGILVSDTQASLVRRM